MNPPTLSNLGLERAVRRMATGFDVPITLHELPTTRLDENVELTAYFVIAEALSNAIKYSGARQIDVRARVARGWLRVEISDDGAGGAQIRPSGGLSGLRDRVEDAGGTFEVVARAAGHGSRLRSRSSTSPVPPETVYLGCNRERDVRGCEEIYERGGELEGPPSRSPTLDGQQPRRRAEAAGRSCNRQSPPRPLPPTYRVRPRSRGRR